MISMSASLSPDHAQLHALAAVGAVDSAVAALRARGERVTNPRRAVLAALASRSSAVTADDVVDLVDDYGIHRATVYRTLDLLADAGVVLRGLVPDGASRYHLTATSPGHEHLHGHCRRCAAVVSIPVDAFVSAIAAIAVSGFFLEPERSTFTGLCAACRAGEA